LKLVKNNSTKAPTPTAVIGIPNCAKVRAKVVVLKFAMALSMVGLLPLMAAVLSPYGAENQQSTPGKARRIVKPTNGAAFAAGCDLARTRHGICQTFNIPTKKVISSENILTQRQYLDRTAETSAVWCAFRALLVSALCASSPQNAFCSGATKGIVITKPSAGSSGGISESHRRDGSTGQSP
jgi:hypothetical protein